MTVTEEYSLHDTNLRFTNLDTRLIQQMFPAGQATPAGNSFGAAQSLTGIKKIFAIDSDVTFDDRKDGPQSHHRSRERKGFANGDVQGDESSDSRCGQFRSSWRARTRPSLPDPRHDNGHGHAERFDRVPNDGAGGYHACRPRCGFTPYRQRRDTDKPARGGKYAASWFDIDAQPPSAVARYGRTIPPEGRAARRCNRSVENERERCAISSFTHRTSVSPMEVRSDSPAGSTWQAARRDTTSISTPSFFSTRARG